MPELVGVVPAAGHARRLGSRSASKEMLGVDLDGSRRPILEMVLAAMAAAGAATALVVTREAKTDLAAYLAARPAAARPRALCRPTPATGSIPETLDVVYDEVRAADVVLGFPDVLFTPPDAMAALVRAHRKGRHDVSLALFASARPDKTDMVEMDGSRITGFRVKPGPCELEYTWLCAAWGPRFSAFLHEFLRRPAGRDRPSELQISEVLAAALAAGYAIAGLPIAGGRFIDVGTPEDLARATASLR